jgi:hypothetical protein
MKNNSEIKKVKMENEQTKKIPDSQLLFDINVTLKELEAYKLLSEGFRMLAEIPENIESGQNLILQFSSKKYLMLQMQCERLLEELYSLKEERGI